jgi:predicted phosphodiesterase
MRIYAISDLHVDYPDNYKWVINLSKSDYQDDVILIAGDVTHELDRLEDVLTLFKLRFKYVFYVPGNHELWLRGNEFTDSIAKFRAIEEICQQLDVGMKPRLIDCATPVTIIPLLTWYTLPEDGEDSLYWPKRGDDPKLEVWSDTHLVKWPDNINPVDFFMQLNQDKSEYFSINSRAVISFSHFLPRQELMYVFGMKIHTDKVKQFNFSRVAGSTKIDDYIRKTNSSMHVYGHHHRNLVKTIDNVTYLSACLGYPHETYNRRVWDFDSGEPLLIWDNGIKIF